MGQSDKHFHLDKHVFNQQNHLSLSLPRAEQVKTSDSVEMTHNDEDSGTTHHLAELTRMITQAFDSHDLRMQQQFRDFSRAVSDITDCKNSLCSSHHKNDSYTPIDVTDF